MNAVSAIIVVGGRPIIFNQERSIENINYYYNYRFSTLILCPRPRPTPWTGCSHNGSRGSINSTLLEWRAARPPWLRCFCRFLCVVADCRISSSSSYVEKWYKTAVRPSLTPLFFGPRRRAPYLWLKHWCYHPTTIFQPLQETPAHGVTFGTHPRIVLLPYFGHAEFWRSASCCALSLANQSAVLELEDRYHHPTPTLIGIWQGRHFLPPWIQRPNLSRCPAVF
jgi:hypothetical protein